MSAVSSAQFLFLILFFCSSAFSAPTPSPTPPAIPETPSAKEVGRQELKTIPKAPSTPAPPGRPGVNEYFNCDRYFIYEGKRFTCDSYMRKDAEKLRPILEEVPEALAELNTYQSNRRTLRNCAYLGTLGLVSVIAAQILKNMSIIPDGGTAQQAMKYGGLGLAGSSFLYGFAVTQRNESHIGKAVQYYNDAKPDRPIQLEFTTGFDF